MNQGNELPVYIEAVKVADLPKLLVAILLRLNALERDVQELRRKVIGVETW